MSVREKEREAGREVLRERERYIYSMAIVYSLNLYYKYCKYVTRLRKNIQVLIESLYGTIVCKWNYFENTSYFSK